MPTSDADLQKLLQQINVLGKVEAAGANGEHVLESTVTTITKLITPAVAALGGLSAIGTAIAAFWGQSETPVRVAVVAGLSAVLVAVCFSLAILVGNDLRSRAAGQVAIYEARRDIAVAALKPQAAGGPSKTTSGAGSVTPGQVALIALAASLQNAAVRGPNGVGKLRGIRQGDDGSVQLYMTLNDGSEDWADLSKVDLQTARYSADGNLQG
jgi:hypothetical protein